MKFIIHGIVLFMCLFSHDRNITNEDGRLFTLVISPGDADRFTHAGFSCWLPDGNRPITALIIHQHGCTNASPEKNPPITLDFHWRALAHKHNCALLVPLYQVAGNCDEWNDPRSGSERAVFSALDEIASRSGHEEIKDAPWILWGHSGGSSWSAQMILRHPERVIAASFRGGCHKQFGSEEFREHFCIAAKDIPLMFVWGKREIVPESRHYVSWEPMNTMYRELREKGSKVAMMIDPRSEHGCGDSRLIIIPFFDDVLTGYLSGLTFQGELRNLTTYQKVPSTRINTCDPSLAWLHSHALAELWQEFSETGTLRPSEPKLKAPYFNGSRTDKDKILLTWYIIPELNGGLRCIRIWRDGKLFKELGVESGAFLATSGDGPPSGLYESRIIDDTVIPGTQYTYMLTYLDAAGNESPPGIFSTAE